MPAIKGIKGIRAAVLGKDDVVEKNTTLGPNGIFDGTGNSAKGIVSANITGLSPSTSEVFGNDIVQYISTGLAQPKVALQINDLPAEIKAAILGQESDGKGGFYDSGDSIPNCALDIIAHDLDNNELHFSFFKGQFTPGNANIQTNNNSPRTQNDELTFSVIGNKSGHLYKVSSSKNSSFLEEDLYKELFPQSTQSSLPSNNG